MELSVNIQRDRKGERGEKWDIIINFLKKWGIVFGNILFHK